jgi:uncharacterized membrane protein
MCVTAWIVVLWIAFTATHLGLASVRVEPRLRAKLGDAGFLGLYSVVALALFVPLMWVYFGNRHAGPWLWHVQVGPVLRVVMYVLMALGVVLAVGSLVRPSPAAVVPGTARVEGVYRVTRHPFVLGLAILWLLHLIPNGSTADVAMFGGFLVFSLLGARHQDARKLHARVAGFADFHAATAFLPFSRPAEALRGLAEIPPLVWTLGIAASLGIRWVHGSIWPH